MGSSFPLTFIFFKMVKTTSFSSIWILVRYIYHKPELIQPQKSLAFSERELDWGPHPEYYNHIKSPLNHHWNLIKSH